MSEHTSGPWVGFSDQGKVVAIMPAGREGDVCTFQQPPSDADARLMILAPALVEALELQEAADLAHVNCDECDGDDDPHTCEKCFPLYDDARIARRRILAAVGSPPATS